MTNREQDKKDANDDAIRGLLDEVLINSELIAGAALGVSLGGPVGVVVGPLAVGFIVRRFKPVLYDLLDRKLSRREKVRTATALYFAEKLVRDQLASGALPRDDLNEEGSTPDDLATMLIEETLQIAQREYDEKKIKYISAMISSFIFHKEIKRGTFVHILEMARHLRYSQMLVLAAYSVDGDIHEFRDSALHPDTDSPETLVLIAQIHDLIDKGLLVTSAGSQPFLGNPVVIPKHLHLTRLGKVTADLLDLRSIATEDPVSLRDIVELLIR